MEIVAKSRYIRTSARKLRLVVPLAKGLSPEGAIVALENSAKRATEPLVKAIKQAVANAVNNLNLKKEELLIKNILIEEGPTYKRWRAGARGRAKPILKRTSHIRIILETKETKGAKETKEVKSQNSKHQAPNSKQVKNSKSK
jgi:large subunit ribosomal protein L22